MGIDWWHYYVLASDHASSLLLLLQLLRFIHKTPLCASISIFCVNCECPIAFLLGSSISLYFISIPELSCRWQWPTMSTKLMPNPAYATVRGTWPVHIGLITRLNANILPGHWSVLISIVWIHFVRSWKLPTVLTKLIPNPAYATLGGTWPQHIWLITPIKCQYPTGSLDFADFTCVNSICVELAIWQWPTMSTK